MYWNPSKVAFHVPIVGHPIAWYGVLFALGFFLAYFFLRWEFRAVTKDRPRAVQLSDRLLWVVIIATILGARLGEILFYEWSYYSAHPWKVLAVWEGGLASHGGIFAILIAIFFYARSAKLSYVTVLDLLVTPCSLAAGFIRIGNFINQEIVGTPTELPWGVVFGQLGPQPLHPVQLYEAVVYLALFVLLWRVGRKTGFGSGLLSGLFFLSAFSARFALEWLKAPQGDPLHSALTRGQWLSLPLLGVGIAFLIYARRSKH